MEVGTVFRIDQPVQEDGFRLHLANEEDYPLYGVIRAKRGENSFNSILYIPRRGKWIKFVWNWRIRHIVEFTEVQV